MWFPLCVLIPQAQVLIPQIQCDLEGNGQVRIVLFPSGSGSLSLSVFVLSKLLSVPADLLSFALDQ